MTVHKPTGNRRWIDRMQGALLHKSEENQDRTVRRSIFREGVGGPCHLRARGSPSGGGRRRPAATSGSLAIQAVERDDPGAHARVTGLPTAGRTVVARRWSTSRAIHVSGWRWPATDALRAAQVRRQSRNCFPLRRTGRDRCLLLSRR